MLTRQSEKEINLDEIDLSKEKVKTLKNILLEKYGDACKVDDMRVHRSTAHSPY